MPERPELAGETTFSKCTGPRCTADVRWVLTEGGKRMPLDPDPHPDGTVVIRRPDGLIRAHVLTGSELPAQETAWRAHWSTCPDSAEFKRRQHVTRPKCRSCLSAMDPWLAEHGYPAHINCLPPLDVRDHYDAARTTTPDVPERAHEQLPGLDQQEAS